MFKLNPVASQGWFCLIVYVEEQFDVKYNHSGMIDWLHNHNFSNKHPGKVPSKAEPKLQQEFIVDYHKLKASLPDYAVLLFGDGVHPTMATIVCQGWIPTGKNKPIKTTASRTRVNIFGTIDLDNMDLTYSPYDTINSDSVCDFLDKLKSQYSSREINLVLDRGPYNKSTATL